MSNHIDTESLPFVVCPTCKGHGTHGPGHVFTQEDRDQYDMAEWDEMMENYRDGIYDVRCETCDGQRVVKGECPCTDCEDEREEEYQLRELERMERMYC